MPYLTDAPSWLITTAAIVGVFAFSILVANIVRAPMIAFQSFRRWRANKAWKLKVAALVEEAPYAERAILAYLVSAGRQAFPAKIDDRRLVPLLAKGIIVQLAGRHSMLDWPHMVQQEVWTYLVENRERFVFENATEVSDPFHWLNRQF